MFRRHIPFPIVFLGLCYYLQGSTAFGMEVKVGDKVITRDVAPMMVGKELRAQVPEGTELTVRNVKGQWVGVVWSQGTKETSGWIHGRNLIDKTQFARQVSAERTLATVPRAKKLANFKAHPQQSGNTCSAAAARNLLFHVTGNAPWEWLLFTEIVSEDHKGLAHLEAKLKQLGIDNPMALSHFGGTPVGVKAVIGKRLRAGLECDFQEIPRMEDRTLVIVQSINNGWPVIAPVVSSSLNHWITITGYDLDARKFSTANFGPISFDRFNTLNSWKTTPGGLLGRAFRLANDEHMGRYVLIYITEKEQTQ